MLQLINFAGPIDLTPTVKMIEKIPSKRNFPKFGPSLSIVTNRIFAALLALSFVGVCFSYQGQSDAQKTAKPGTDEKVILKMPVQIPTPKESEVVVVFDNGSFAVARQNQIVTIPANEKFRSIVGEHASLNFSEKGETSGNNFWIVKSR